MKFMGADLEKLKLVVGTIPGIYSNGDIYSPYDLKYTEKSLIDDENTISIFDEVKGSYSQGVIQTKRLTETTDAIVKLIVDEITSNYPTTKSTYDISFDDGGSWSTGKILNAVIDDFTGTSSDAGTYKLKLKFALGSTYGAGTWTTTSALTEIKYGLAGCGTTSAALCMGGSTGVPLDTTEIWNGSIWATTTSLNDAKYGLAGCGTISSALCFGWTAPSVPEIWNGSIWATTTSLTETKYGLAGCGTTSNALCMGGAAGPPVDTTEIWNGSIWSTTTSLTETKFFVSGCGTTSNALCMGGYNSVVVNTTEIWNGSIWTTTSSLTGDRAYSAGCGTTSSALCMGGNIYGPPVDTTEYWNGSTWTITTSLTEVKGYLSGCGTALAALCMGGYNSTYVDTTEIWNAVGISLGFMAKYET